MPEPNVDSSCPAWSSMKSRLRRSGTGGDAVTDADGTGRGGLGEAAVRPPARDEHEQHADAGDERELDALELPEAAGRLVDGRHVDVRAGRVWLYADGIRVREEASGGSAAPVEGLGQAGAVPGPDELVDHESVVQVRPAAALEPGRPDGREQPLLEPAVHDGASDDINDEGDEQRRHGSTPQDAERDGGPEDEHGVRDRHDAFRVVRVRAHPAVEMIERRPRPHREGDDATHADDARDGAERELGDDPATAGDA